MSSIALFRLPHADDCTLMLQTAGEPQTFERLPMLDGCRGFVFAPFAPAPENPILLLRPDVVRSFPCRDVARVLASSACLSGFSFFYTASANPQSASERQHYHLHFRNFHAQLCEGAFRKIVLARCSCVGQQQPRSPFELFQQACARYPRMFISLVSTPQGGTWLTATPEVLLEKVLPQPHDDCCFRTIALAGTVGYADDVRWSEKNIREQRYVATYIMETLEHFSHDITEEGPYTTRAANLAHLRSDFTFRLPDDRHLGTLLHALHPSPAVCGLPKREAFHFILHNESVPRRYYSGFQGLLGVGGMTHLYVSLRCMSIHPNHYRLYAGGGLLSDSDEESEWQETEAKLNTMRNVLE